MRKIRDWLKLKMPEIHDQLELFFYDPCRHYKLPILLNISVFTCLLFLFFCLGSCASSASAPAPTGTTLESGAQSITTPDTPYQIILYVPQFYDRGDGTSVTPQVYAVHHLTVLSATLDVHNTLNGIGGGYTRFDVQESDGTTSVISLDADGLVWYIKRRPTYPDESSSPLIRLATRDYLIELVTD